MVGTWVTTVDTVVDRAADAKTCCRCADGKGVQRSTASGQAEAPTRNAPQRAFRMPMLLDHGVDGGHHVPTIGSAHPIVDSRCVCAEFGSSHLGLRAPRDRAERPLVRG